MNIKQIMLFTILLSAPIAAMQENKKQQIELSTFKTFLKMHQSASGFSLCGTNLADQQSQANQKNKKWSNPKKTVMTLLGIALVAQCGELLADCYITADLGPNQITLYPRQAVATMEPQTTSCDVQTIGCSNEEKENFEQICKQFNKTDFARKLRKKREHNKQAIQENNNLTPQLYSMINKPKNCTQACDSVENIQECAINSIENGRVIIKECTVDKTEKTNNLWNLAMGSLISHALSSSMTILAIIALYEETTGCTNNL